MGDGSSDAQLQKRLDEALEREAATAEILKIISSSPANLEPVFDAILARATRLCEAHLGVLQMREGDSYRAVAEQGATPEFKAWLFEEPRRLNPATGVGRALLEGRVIHIADITDDPAYRDRHPARVATVELGGARTFLTVPMLRAGEAIGAIVIYRPEVRPFTDKQIALLQIFADQAVIAIENVRLFTETREALERQTATGEILRVISSSPTDVQPVFDAVAASAARLCEAIDAAVFRVDGDALRLVAHQGAIPAHAPLQGPPLVRGTVPGRAVLDCRTIHVTFGQGEDDEYPEGTEIARRFGHRTVLCVPLLRAGQAIGVIAVRRTEARPFNDRQAELLKTFADQAVIAIENVRLFKELEERTAELGRSVDELTALGQVSQTLSSTLDLETVLTTVVSRALDLSGAEGGSVYEYDDGTMEFRLRATQNLEKELVEASRAMPLRRGEGALGMLAERRQPVQIADISDPAVYQSAVRDLLIRTGYRALLALPLLHEDRVIGALVVCRKVTGEFPPGVVDLLTTFTNQSALAIQNARLFRELAEKSRELEAASRHKSEFLANMSHELRTPLNAIIGFSEVLTERMFGELNEKQEEYLKDIHASGQHLLSLINDILDLSKVEAGRMELELKDFDLPQAISNAVILVRERAGRRSIALHQDVDQNLGQIRSDERKVKQVLLNLLSNALKFTPEGGQVDVRATTVDGMAQVSVTDTGVGIAPEDQEAVFEEFRQVGTADKKVEGTGLGLTLSRKFIELHGGRIWVKSEVGRGSTFTFTLPFSKAD